MINLSNASVGDKFLDESDSKQILELVLVSDSKYGTDYVFKYEKTSELLLTKSNGRSEDLTHCWITAKVDPRQWLKYLPSADLLASFRVDSIHCDGLWWATHKDLTITQLTHKYMPKLSSDEMKQSKINIADLRVWQEQNK